MATWEPKLQPPHPSTVSDISEDARKILATLDRKWETSYLKNRPALNGPLATRTSATNYRPVHTPNYYQQIYAAKFGRLPPSVPVILPRGTCTPSVSGLTAAQAITHSAVLGRAGSSNVAPPPSTAWLSRLPNAPTSGPQRPAPSGAAWQSQRNMPSPSISQICCTSQNISQYTNTQASTVAGSESPVMDFGSDEEGQDLVQYLTQPLQQCPPFASQPYQQIIQHKSPQLVPLHNISSKPVTTIDLSPMNDSQCSLKSPPNTNNPIIPMITIDLSQIDDSDSSQQSIAGSPSEIYLKDSSRAVLACNESLNAVTPITAGCRPNVPALASSKVATTAGSWANVLASPKVASMPGSWANDPGSETFVPTSPTPADLTVVHSPPYQSYITNSPSTAMQQANTTPEKAATVQFKLSTSETIPVERPPMCTAQNKSHESPCMRESAAKQSASRAPAPHKQSRSGTNLSETSKAKLIQSVMKTKTKQAGTPPDNKSIRDMLSIRKRPAEKEKQQDHTKISVTKKKKKFQVPFKSQISEEPEISNNLNEDNIKITNLTCADEIKQLVYQLSNEPPIEICITILYKEGSCQLGKCEDKAKRTGASSPCGLVMAVLGESKPVTFYFLALDTNKAALAPHFKAQRSLVQTLLLAPCRKVCFKTQELFVYLIHVFDFKYHEVSLKWVVIDPLIGCWLLNPDAPPGDFSQAMQHLGLNRKKDTSSKAQLRACGNLVLLSQAAEVMYQQLVDRGLWRVFLDIESPIISMLAVMEMRGISVEKNCLKEIGNALEGRLKLLRAEANKVIGAHVLLTSPQQLRKILYDQLKLDAKLKIPLTLQGGGKSTSEHVLKLLEPLHPLPGIILEFRHLQKINSTYIEGIIPFVLGGQLRTTWEQIAAATGRVTSRDPNVQAIPKQPVSLHAGDGKPKKELWLRSAFMSKQGHSLLSADFQHIELRLFAHFAQDPALTAMFAQKEEDVFELLARQWLGHSKTREVTLEEREQTKRVVYAVMYGAGMARLEQVLQVDSSEARRILTTFTAKFPQIRNFTQRLIRRARDQGYIASLSGRRRLFPNITSSDPKLRSQSERQAVNFLIQGSAADVCKAAMLATEHALQAHLPEPLHAELLLQIHDELVWEVPDCELHQLKDLVQKAMEGTRSQFKITLPLPVALGSGKTWAQLK